MRIGFVGTGTITEAVVKGLLRFGARLDTIALSPRNAEVAARLAALDARVHVCQTNQEVLDSSDVVCLAVRPQIAAEVLAELEFAAHHHVISFIAGFPLAELHRSIRNASKVVRAIPLPAVAEGKGSTAICPVDDIAKFLFSMLGEAVEVDDEKKFDALSAVTATMASFYAVLESQALWLVRQGLGYGAARAFMSGYCVGLAHDTTRTEQPFSKMIEQCMTPGGINEQLHAELLHRGNYSHYGNALDKVLSRIEGRA